MTRLRTIYGTATCAAALAFMLTTALSADTYEVINLGASTVDSGLVGITDSGTVVIMQELGIPEDIVYDVFPLNGASYVDFNAPNFTYDDGTFNCTPTTSAGVTWAAAYGSTTCNGSHEEYEGFYTPPGGSGTQLGIFGGPDLSDLVPVAGFGISSSDPYIYGAELNTSGDFAFVGPGGYLEAVDLTTAVPEPRTDLLGGIGAMAIAGAWRRRRYTFSGTI